MAVAFLSAMRSKDPCSQVGACIVDEQKRIVGVGYNGMPTGCSDDDLPWGKVSTNRLETKYMYGESIMQKFQELELTADMSTTSVPCRDECHHEQK